MRCEKSFCQQPQKKHHLSHISVTFGPAQNTTASLDFGGIGQDSLAAKRGHILQSERSKKERKKNQKSKKKKKKIIRVFFQTERIEKVHKRCMLQRRKLRRNKSEPGDGEKESETEHFKQTAGRQSWW
jgi:hypothetical protein